MRNKGFGRQIFDLGKTLRSRNVAGKKKTVTETTGAIAVGHGDWGTQLNNRSNNLLLVKAALVPPPKKKKLLSLEWGGAWNDLDVQFRHNHPGSQLDTQFTCHVPLEFLKHLR